MVRSPVCEVSWRVLDAQYWGVPQRRRRIFLVADFAAGEKCAGKVLFEPEGMPRHFASGKETREGTARGTKDCARTAGRIIAAGFDTRASIAQSAPVLTEATPPMTVNNRLGVMKEIYDMTHADEVMRPVKDGVVPTLNARMGTGGNQVPVVHCVGNGQLNQVHLQEKVGALNCRHDQQCVLVTSTVRRLTPTECERLQGLPDGYTEGGSDTARYKALGNGMAQPCANWVIKRIKEVTIT